MAKARQFRYYGINSPKNYPIGDEVASGEHAMNATNLINGKVFNLTENNPAFQIGIQSLPGTKFYLNGKNGDNSIIIGSTGIYELNTENININMTDLRFDYNSIKNIINNNNAYLIVDVIYMKDSASGGVS